MPPPDLWIMAAIYGVENFFDGVADGSTKQAESWPSWEPAFISVGELGRKRQSVIMS